MGETKFSLSRANLSDQVADSLEDWILNSQAKKGVKKLPSEQQLTEQFEVSRPVVREALKILQERGLVKLKNGLGAFVTKPKNSTVEASINRFKYMNNISDDELAEVRAIIEVEAARLAAKNATEEDIACLKENLSDYSNNPHSLDEYIEIDRQFHVLIARASKNSLLEMFNDVLISLLSEYMGKGATVDSGIEDAKIRHEKLIEAIESHDEEKAIDAMKMHLDSSRTRVKRYSEQ